MSVAVTPAPVIQRSGQTVDGYIVSTMSKSGNTFTVQRLAAGTYSRSCVANTAGAGCPTTLSW
jgi:hypothetical protein